MLTDKNEVTLEFGEDRMNPGLPTLHLPHNVQKNPRIEVIPSKGLGEAFTLDTEAVNQIGFDYVTTRINQMLGPNNVAQTDLGNIKYWDVVLVRKFDENDNVVVEAYWVPEKSVVDSLSNQAKYKLSKGYDLETLVHGLTLKVQHVFDESLAPEVRPQAAPANLPGQKKEATAPPSPKTDVRLAVNADEALNPTLPNAVEFEGTADAFKNKCTVDYAALLTDFLTSMLASSADGMSHSWGPESVAWINQFDVNQRIEACHKLREAYLSFLNQKQASGETARPRHWALEQQTLTVTTALELIIIKTAIDNQEWDQLAFFVKSLIRANEGLNEEKGNTDTDKTSERAIIEHLGKILCAAMGLQVQNCKPHSVKEVQDFLFKLCAQSARTMIPTLEKNYRHLDVDQRIDFIKKIVVPANFSNDLWAIIEGDDPAFDTLYRLQNTALFLAALKTNSDKILGFTKTFMSEGLNASDTAKIDKFVKSKAYRATMQIVMANTRSQAKARVVTPSTA